MKQKFAAPPLHWSFVVISWVAAQLTSARPGSITEHRYIIANFVTGINKVSYVPYCSRITA